MHNVKGNDKNRKRECEKILSCFTIGTYTAEPLEVTRTLRYDRRMSGRSIQVTSVLGVSLNSVIGMSCHEIQSADLYGREHVTHSFEIGDLFLVSVCLPRSHM